MKTIKVNAWIRGYLSEITIATDKIVGVRNNIESPPYHTAILMTNIGEIYTNESTIKVNNKIRFA
jgi:hypothetical protein